MIHANEKSKLFASIYLLLNLRLTPGIIDIQVAINGILESNRFRSKKTGKLYQKKAPDLKLGTLKGRQMAWRCARSPPSRTLRVSKFTLWIGRAQFQVFAPFLSAPQLLWWDEFIHFQCGHEIAHERSNLQPHPSLMLGRPFLGVWGVGQASEIAP